MHLMPLNERYKVRYCDYRVGVEVVDQITFRVIWWRWGAYQHLTCPCGEHVWSAGPFVPQEDFVEAQRICDALNEAD